MQTRYAHGATAGERKTVEGLHEGREAERHKGSPDGNRVEPGKIRERLESEWRTPGAGEAAARRLCPAIKGQGWRADRSHAAGLQLRKQLWRGPRVGREPRG